MKPIQYKIKEKKIEIHPIKNRAFVTFDCDDPVFPSMFNAEPPDNDFVNSIIDNGMIHPVVIAEYEDGTRVLKVGRRRVWAAREAYKLCADADEYEDDAKRVRDIPAMLYRDADRISSDMWTLVENFQRGDNPIAELDAVKALIAQHHLTSGGGWEDLGHAIGADKTYVKKIMNTWGKLPVPILDGVREGKIAMGTAEKVTKLKKEQQDDLVDTFRQTETITGTDVSEAKRVSRDMEVSQISMSKSSKDWDDLLSNTASPWEIFEKHIEMILKLEDSKLRSVLKVLLINIKTRTLK